MIFNSKGEPVHLVMLVARDEDVGFVIGAYVVDEPPPDDELDAALYGLYCHQTGRSEDDAAEIEGMVLRGELQAVTATFDPQEVLPFYEPAVDASVIPLTESDVEKMEAEELLEYRDILLEQSKEYVSDPTVMTHNTDMIAEELRKRMEPRGER